MDDQRADPVVLLVDDDDMERFLHRQALELPGLRSSRRKAGLPRSKPLSSRCLTSWCSTF